MIPYHARFAWYFTLILFGACMAWFSYAGLVEHLRPEIAIPVAITLPGILSICFLLWHKTGQKKWALFSLSMVVMMSTVHGIAANTHLSHEDSDLARTVTTSAEANARIQQLQQARDDYADLISEGDALAAEIARIEAGVADLAGLETEIAALETEIYTIDNDRQKWNDNQIPAMKTKLSALLLSLDRARIAVKTDTQQIAGLQAQLEAKRTRATQERAAIASLDAGVLTATTTAQTAQGREKFLFQLADRVARGDSLGTQGVLALGGLLGGLLVELIYGFCWMVPVSRPRRAIAATGDAPKTARLEPDAGETLADPAAESRITLFPGVSRNIAPVENPISRAMHRPKAAPIPEPADVLSAKERRIRNLTVGELTSNTLSRGDEDKALRRLNHKLALGLDPKKQIDSMVQAQVRTHLHKALRPYVATITLGEILVADLEAKEELEVAA